MTTKETGGPAFPTENERQVGPNAYRYEGMTLRDYFAAKAMQGDISSYIAGKGINAAALAKWSYEIADAMLQARKA